MYLLCHRAKLLYAATAGVSMFHCFKELQHVHGAAHWHLQRWAEEAAYPRLALVEEQCTLRATKNSVHHY